MMVSEGLSGLVPIVTPAMLAFDYMYQGLVTHALAGLGHGLWFDR